MTDLRIYNLIHKDLTGEISEAEKLELKALENTSEYQTTYEEIESLWIGSKDYFPQKAFDVNAAKAKFKQKLKQEEVVDEQTSVSSSDSRSNRWPIVIGALLLFGALSYLVYTFSQSPLKEVQTEILENNNIEYAMLEDNSEVWLSPDAELKAESFDGKDKRQLSLSGEAFFDVTSNPSQPFHVSLGNGNHIEVLGTAFNVRTDIGDGTAKVDVKEGSVRLYNEFNKSLSTIVTAGESSTINGNTETLNKEHSSKVYSLLGTSLSFRDAVLSDVFNELSEVYSVTFNFEEDDYNSCGFNSPLLDNMSVDEILEIIQNYYIGLNIEKSEAGSYNVSGVACD